MTGKTQSTSKIAQLLWPAGLRQPGDWLGRDCHTGFADHRIHPAGRLGRHQSSPRLSAWLENHRLFGPILFNWRNGKIIARRAKVSATVSMVLCAVLMLVMLDHGWPVYLAIAGMSLGNLWIWSRPEQLARPV